MRIALAIGLCLVAAVAAAAPRGKAESKPEDAKQVAPAPGSALREAYRSRLNQNVITIVAGSPGSTDLSIASDIAEVLDDGDNLRVLPVVGKGAAQNVKDVLFLRGVDMGITQANILRHFASTGELGANFVDQITYVSKLFNEEIHLLVRPDVTDISQLDGKTVNLGEEGSGTDITGHLLLEALGVHVQEVHLGDDDALGRVKSGEIAGAIIMAGKPAPGIANLKDATGLKLLPIPYAKGLENDYYPATLTHADYPELVGEGDRVDTVAVCAVLIAFNWDQNSSRYAKGAKFVDALFSKFDDFRKPPHHPKWRDVNFAATLEGWHRSPVAQNWIDHAESASAGDQQQSFDAFLAEDAKRTGAPVSDADRAQLFKAFLEWSKSQQSH